MASSRRIVPVLVLCGLLVIAAATGLYSYRELHQKQRPLRILGLTDYHDTTGRATWGKRPPSPVDEDAGKSYLAAWTAWNLHLLGDRESKLERFFSGPALRKLTASLRQTTEHRIRQMDSEHRLTLIFLSDDRTVLEFQDVVEVERAVLRSSGEAREIGTTTDHYRVLMALQDGVWRVEQWERSNPNE